MPQLLGEYECKIDAKGRVRLPTDLLKQLGDAESYTFVINRGFEKCLMLYPEVVWNKITKEINELNTYNEKNRQFMRYFYRGAMHITTDSAERILLSKRLTDYAGIDKDIILFAYHDRIEIWDQITYDELLEEEPENFSRLAQEVMDKAAETKEPGTGWTSDQ